MKYKKKCTCGNELIFTDYDKYIECEECGKRYKNPHYIEEYDDEDYDGVRRVEVRHVYEKQKDEGSSFAGFLLVFFLGFIGWVIALILDKKKTKKVANITFLIEFILGIFIAVIVLIIFGAALSMGDSVDPIYSAISMLM